MTTVNQPPPLTPPWVKLPFLIQAVFVLTLASAALGDIGILGFNVKGWAWVASLLVALHALVTVKKRAAFPLWIWMPWVTVLIGYLLVSSSPNALLRTTIMICPIVVATAVSKLDVDREIMALVYRRLQQGALVLAGILVVKSGIALTGILPDVTGLAAEVMTGNLLAAVFAAAYALGIPGALRYWAMMVALPVIALTRTVIVSTALSLPVTFAPLKLSRRFAAILLVASLALLVFQTERVQNKMFYSGQGKIEDLALENEDLRMSGRLRLWKMLDEEIEARPWFGHGANAQEEFIFDVIAIRGQPHNDWKRLIFDYGYAGAGVFGFTIFFQMLHTWRRVARGRGLPLVTRVMYFAGAGAFLAFAIIMLTDNIILYASFFGNLHFAILGLAYASEEEGPWAAAPDRASLL